MNPNISKTIIIKKYFLFFISKIIIIIKRNFLFFKKMFFDFN